MVINYRCNFVKPGLQDVMNWEKKSNSWNKTTDSNVSNALRTVQLDKKYTFNVSYTTRHKRFGPMIQQKIDLENK